MDPSTLSVVLAGISLITAVSSTFITSFMNNRHEDKMFKKNFYTKRKHEVIENYLKCLGRVIFWNNTQNQSEIAEWISEIYMYAPKELWNDIDEMNKLVLQTAHNRSSSPSDQIKDRYIEFCKKFDFLDRDYSNHKPSRRFSLKNKSCNK